MANDLRLVVDRFAVSNGTGNKTFTSPVVGTVVGALIFGSHAINDGAWIADASMSIGAVTGVANEWNINSLTGDGDNPSDDQVRSSDINCVRIDIGAGGGVPAIEAEFVSFPASGIQLNFTQNNDANVFIIIVFFLSDTISIHADDQAGSATIDTVVDVTTPGFQPDVVLMSSAHQDFDEIRSGFGRISMGVALNDGADKQRGLLWRSQSGVSPTNPQAKLTTNRVSGDAANAQLKYEVDDFDANGFSVISREHTIINKDFGFMCFEVDGLKTYIDDVDLPNANGEVSFNVGFKAGFAMLLISELEAVDGVEIGAQSGSFTIAVMDGDREFCVGFHYEDNVAESNTFLVNDNQAVRTRQHDGTNSYIGTFVSFTNPNITLDFTAVPVNKKKAVLFALEESGGQDVTLLRRRQEENY